MIPILDIMIGDWVYDGDKTQFPMYVRTIGEDYVYLDFPENEGMDWESTPDELQGIPLTPELMTSIGFTYKDGLWRHRINRRSVVVKIETGFAGVEAFDDKLMDSRGWSHNIKYLHELQNFYRIIARKEINLPEKIL